MIVLVPSDNDVNVHLDTQVARPFSKCSVAV